MSLTYICVALIGVFTNNLLVEVFSLHMRITIGYVISLSMLMLVTLFDVAYEVFPDHLSYKITLVAIGIIAFGCTSTLHNYK